MVIAHASDPHLGERPVNFDRLRQLARHLRARHDAGEAIALALTGDLTHDGQPLEWVDLHEALGPVRGHLPLWVVPGNHDCGRLGITYDPKRAAQARLEISALADAPLRDVCALKVWTWGGYKVIGLDSQRGNEGGALPPLARGQLGAAQLAALEVELADELPTIILLHHHPRWSDPGHVLIDANALLALLQRRPHVRYVLYGHQHVEATWGSEGSRRWLASGKVTDLDADGRLRYRTIDLVTGHVQAVTCPAP